jgi:hypothetical protein
LRLVAKHLQRQAEDAHRVGLIVDDQDSRHLPLPVRAIQRRAQRRRSGQAGGLDPFYAE